jgi:outer membrane translocation and assembly module TamA
VTTPCAGSTHTGFEGGRHADPGWHRFEIWSALDGALFYDTGKVADQFSDLDFKHLEHDYGFGFRFNTDAGIVLRVDAGFGSSDGKHLYIVFGSRF